MKLDDAPIFDYAISWDGRLSRDFSEYASELFMMGRARLVGADLMADAEMEQGNFPDINCFSPIKKRSVDLPEMRTQLSDFVIDDQHGHVLRDNCHLSFRLHNDFDEAIRSDSAHHHLHSAYEKSVYGRDIDHLTTSNMLTTCTKTPGMQGYLLDIHMPSGDMVASVQFQIGGRASYCVYHIYEPAARDQHIGRFAILSTMMTLKQAAACNYFYIGTFDPGNSHYRWKSRLQPAEIWIDDQWQPLNSRTGNLIRKQRHASKAEANEQHKTEAQVQRLRVS